MLPDRIKSRNLKKIEKFLKLLDRKRDGLLLLKNKLVVHSKVSETV